MFFVVNRDPDQRQKKPDPFDDKAEIVTGGGEDGIYGISLFVGEEVSVHTTPVFEVPDDRFNSRAAFHLTFDGGCDTAFLSGGKDAHLVNTRCVVAPVSGICEGAFKRASGEVFDLGNDRF